MKEKTKKELEKLMERRKLLGDKHNERFNKMFALMNQAFQQFELEFDWSDHETGVQLVLLNSVGQQPALYLVVGSKSKNILTNNDKLENKTLVRVEELSIYNQVEVLNAFDNFLEDYVRFVRKNVQTLEDCGRR
jgi:hypothetical protein